MTDLLNSEIGWLNLTNAALGLAVLVCLFALGRVILQDMRVRVASRARRPVLHDDHAFRLSSLGITMADGGELIDEASIEFNREKSDDVPPNIIRSDN